MGKERRERARKESESEREREERPYQCIFVFYPIFIQHKTWILINISISPAERDECQPQTNKQRLLSALKSQICLMQIILLDASLPS